MKQILPFLIMLLLSAASVSAQRNTAPLMSVSATYKPVEDNSNLYAMQLKVSLLSTTGISKVRVKLGTEKGASDLLNKDFIYDVSGTFEDSTSYSRLGNKITLGLGNYAKMERFYGEVSVVRTDNSVSDAITFSR